MTKRKVWVVLLLLLFPGASGVVSLRSQEKGVNLGVQIPAIPPVRLPDGISLDVPLSEEDAVAVALWNNAAFQADLAALGLAKVDLLEAGLLRNPTLQMLLPFGYSQFEMLLNLPGEVFWQRPKRVAAAKIEVERVATGLEQNGLDLARNVREVFADLQLAKARMRLGEDAVRLRREILELTEVRLRAGDIGEMEANAARTELSMAEEQAARFAREHVLVHGRLRFLLGLEVERRTFDIAPPGGSGTPDEAASYSQAADVEALQETAFANRPDLGAAALAIEAAAGRAKWERSKLFAFAGLLSIKQGAGLDFSPRGGFLIELPVFQRNQGGISRADLEVERAGLQYLVVHQRISQEVREAYGQFQQARKSLQFYRSSILPQAEERMRLAEKSHQSGEESYLFVLDATRRMTDARLREAELVSDLRRASARLDRSIGRRLHANK